MVEVSIPDKYVISMQINRKARGIKSIPARCGYGFSQVVEVMPVLETGEPFPTIYWLTCPQLVKEISHLEADGKIKDIDDLIQKDTVFCQELRKAHEQYSRVRDSSIQEIPEKKDGKLSNIRNIMQRKGIGGMRCFDTTKCLHLHYAHYMVTSDNPIGKVVSQMLPVKPPIEKRCSGYCKKYDLCRKKLASIDVGTNSTRLLICNFDKRGSLIPISSELTITRLGKNVDEKGILAQESIDKTVTALKRYFHTMKNQGVSMYKAVGTSALRDGVNRDEFINKAKSVSNIYVKTIPGKQEAFLGYLGAVIGLKDAGFKSALEASTNLIIDIGGGSTEFSQGCGEVYQGVHSVDVGAVRINEMFFRGDPPKPEEIEAAIEYIDKEIAPAINQTLEANIKYVVGVGGTITTAVAILESMEPYDSKKVHGYTLKQKTIKDLCNDLTGLELSYRKNIPGLPRGRADIIPAGLLILLRIMKALERDKMLVSDTDILHGLLYDQSIKFMPLNS